MQEILSALKWSRRKRVVTRHGEKRMREAEIDEKHEEIFLAEWKARGSEFKQLGMSLSRRHGRLHLTEWSSTVADEPSPVLDRDESPPPEQNIIVSIPPEIADKLREYQVPSARAVASAIKTFGSALDASDLGSGKTYVALAVAKTLGLSPGIVCPKAVMNSWRRVAENHFGMTPYFVINYDLLRLGGTLIGHWEGLKSSKFVWNVPDDMLLILDEAHRLKTASSKTCRMGVGALDQKLKILAMSGTLAENPTDMRFSGQLAGLHRGADFGPWMLSNGCEKMEGKMIFTGGPHHLARIHRQIFPKHGARLRRPDIPNFPDCDIQVEAYNCADNTRAIRDTYEELYFELARIESLENVSKKDRHEFSFAAQQHARQQAELLKVPAIAEMAQDYVENNHSVAIFTNYRRTIEVLSEKLGVTCIVQGTSSKSEEIARQKSVDDFQADTQRIILVNIQAGGAGLSLHDLNGTYPRVAIICPTWNAMDLSQSLGRVWRDGAKTKALQRIFFAAGTIEEDICERVRQKLKNIETINNGDLTPKGIF